METLSKLSLYKSTQEFVSFTRRIISGSTELEVVRFLVKGLKKFVEFDSLTVYVLHEATSMLYPMITEDDSSYRIQYQDLALPLNAGIIGRAVKTGKPELILNAHEDPRSVYPDNVCYDAEQLMVFPLMHNNRCWGGIAISRISHIHFSSHDFEVSEHLVSYASIALNNITLSKQLTETKSRSNVVHAIPDTILRINGSLGKILFFSTEGNEVGRPQCFSESDCKELLTLLVTAINTGNEVSYEHVLEELGSKRYFETRLIPIYSSECLSITRDVTGLKKAQVKPVNARDVAGTTPEYSEKNQPAIQQPPGINRPILQNRRVLLAEDNPVNQISGVKILESWGLHVTLVSNGKEAISKLDTDDFDLIIMDIQMPEMDGIEATRIIRNSANKNGTPIIAMTTAINIQSIDAAYAAGANGHITKPFKPYELQMKIKDLVGNPENNSQQFISRQKPPARMQRATL